ncbi:ciliogenesis-associated TTC17-interacting protein [Solenopsis invicta]|uniref:ciliogenesis-associated TTC17-interacting protein n=1 Tax=Solenopsis invicta TaxID=13686 RepID=UPI000595C0B6|nr:ciliogenesis-associated TTC17-interacting protein [Solenopsis invicta]
MSNEGKNSLSFNLINTFLDSALNETNENMNAQIPLKKWWMQDTEMLSKYLDMKSCNIAEYTDYLADYPEVKQLIADYVQTLLVVKPVNVIDFTIQHFKAFARKSKSWDTIDILAKQFD